MEERLLFRDILRSSKNLAKEYQELKRNLAIEYANDRELYTEKKSPFIQNVIANDSNGSERPLATFAIKSIEKASHYYFNPYFCFYVTLNAVITLEKK